MFNFFKKKTTNENIKDFEKVYKTFNQELILIRVILFAEFIAEIKQTVDAEHVKYLGAQIVNFLTGEDLNDIYQQVDENQKRNIEFIREKISPVAHQKMKADYKTRELVVYTLRMIVVFDFASKGEDYFNSNQYKCINDILSIYGKEFPIEADPDLYTKIVTSYQKERYKFVQQANQKQ